MTSTDVISSALFLTVPHNLFNQGLQFNFSSAPFFTQTVLLRIVNLKKKSDAFLKCIIYT